MWSFAMRRLPPGTGVLRINLDETACRLHYPAGVGFATGAYDPGGAPKARIVQNVSRSMMRSAFTHIALICDDSSLQPCLPQILLGNEHLFTKQVLDAARATLPPNVVVWRRKSGWVTQDILCQAVDVIHDAISSRLQGRQVLLLLDACPVHLCPRFMRHCAKKGFWLHYVPAKLTWLLQPLDTHVFARYKQWISNAYRKHILEGDKGACELTAMIEIVANSTRHVFQKHKWSSAFRGNGYDSDQADIRQGIKRQLQWTACPPVSQQLPSYEQFAIIFPRRRHLPLQEYLAVYRRTALASSLVATLAKPAMSLQPSDAHHGVWEGRLRSSRVAHSRDGSLKPKPCDRPAAQNREDSERLRWPMESSTADIASQRIPMGRLLFRARAYSQCEEDPTASSSKAMPTL